MANLWTAIFGRGARMYSTRRPPAMSPGVRPRPPILRALGAAEPPAEIQIQRETLRLVEVLKHDSWAATAIYGSDAAKVVCKFNRTQSILLLPMRWLGRYLARKETRLLEQFAHLGTIPPPRGPVCVAGETLASATAHDYVPGHPLQKHERVGESFFAELRHTLDAIHAGGVAYVDLHKRENILVGDDGRPWLIDFQVCFELPRRGLLPSAFSRWLLRLLQQGDVYHLQKHIAKSRPDLCDASSDALRPWWIRLHRVFAVRLRTMRRNLLVWLGVRAGKGAAQSEQFVEDGLRPVAPQVEITPPRRPVPQLSRIAARRWRATSGDGNALRARTYASSTRTLAASARDRRRD